MPEEAQWEYACRGGGRLEQFCGGQDADDVAWHAGNSGLMTHPVGLKASNGFGLHDMSGNVAEWCEDAWDPNAGAPNAWDRHARPDPACQASPTSKASIARSPSSDTQARIGRGGSFGYLLRHVRASFHEWFAPDSAHPDPGLRLVRSEP